MRKVKWQRGLSATTTQPSGTTQAGKTLVPLLGVLAALAIVVAAVAIVLQRQEREKREAKEHELQQQVIENEDLQARLQDIQQAKTKVEEDLTRTRKELAESHVQLVKAVEAQGALTHTVEDREQEIAHLTNNLTKAQEETKALSAQLAQLQTERDTLKQQLAGLERAKGELESKALELSERPAVELEKVRVTNEQSQGSQAASGGGVPAAATNGQVVVVNREYDFIVMNLGRNHGLAVGQEFQIVRDNQVLGKVKVEKVYDELSAAAILPESQKDNIREGDTVKAL